MLMLMLMLMRDLLIPTIPLPASTSAVLALDTDGGGNHTVVLHREGHLRGIARDIA
jgi:hypothetical protein